MVFRIPPPIEKQRLYGPFVGDILKKIANERHRLVFGNDRPVAMPALQIVRQCRGFAPKCPIRVLKNRNQIWPQVPGLFPQRLGHDHPVERNPSIAEKRAQLDRVGRCCGSDQPITFFIHGLQSVLDVHTQATIMDFTRLEINRRTALMTSAAIAAEARDIVVHMTMASRLRKAQAISRASRRR